MEINWDKNIQAFYHLPDYESITGELTNNAFGFKNFTYMQRFVKRMPGAMGLKTLASQIKDYGQVESSIYIHIPFCHLSCSYCGFYRKVGTDVQIARYVETLLKEIEQVAQSGIYANKPIKAAFFGGGTPSVLNTAQITNILKLLHQNFNITSDCELTFESSIYDMNQDKLAACIDGGINRFSFGVQSFDTALRRSFGRPDTQEKLCSDLELYAKSSAKIIIDLIYGLPGQSYESIIKDIDLAKNIGVAGMDLYKLQLLKQSPLANQIAEGKKENLLDEAELEKRFIGAADYLNQRAKRLSCCHWAFREDEFSGYNTYVKQGMDNLALGVSCGGRYGLLRYMKSRDTEKYIEQIHAGESPYMAFSTFPENTEILNAITSQIDQGFLDFNVLHTLHSMDLHLLLKPLLDKWQSLGLLKYQQNNYYKLTQKGTFWYRHLIRVALFATEYALYGEPTENEVPTKAYRMMGMGNLK